MHMRMNGGHQVLVALCEAHAMNVAAMTTVLPARGCLGNARPLEQFHLQNATVTIFGRKAKVFEKQQPFRSHRQWQRQLHHATDTNL